MPRKSLDHQIQIIRDELLLLSSMVETALVESVSALKDHDMEKSRIVYENDVQINAQAIRPGRADHYHPSPHSRLFYLTCDSWLPR